MAKLRRKKFPRAEHLSAGELAGQLLMPALNASFLNRQRRETRKILQWVRHFQVGGIVLFGGHPADILNLTHFLNRESRYPLLFAADLERGLGGLFQHGTILPHALAIGAGRRQNGAEDYAEVVASEARAVGINVFFGPVLDLSDDRRNPIINIRGFHHSHQEVSRLAERIIPTVQKLGIACVPKHFPGHGATKVDSHSDLPQLAKNLTALKNADLLPFAAAAHSGCMGLMAGHLIVKEMQRPACMEPALITGLLRDEWNFQGVVFTDALEMGAIQKHFSPWEQINRPIEAGADILLMPRQLPLAHRLLSERLASDAAFRKLAEKAVDRIFNLKRQLHKLQPSDHHPLRIFKVLEHPNHHGIARRIAEEAITAVHCSDRFPPDIRCVNRLIHCVFTDTPQTTRPLEELNRQIRQVFEESQILENPAPAVVGKLRAGPGDLVLISLYFRTFATHQPRLNWRRVNALLRSLSGSDATIIVLLLGNPYHLRHLRNIENVDAVLLSYSYVAPSQIAAFRAACGFIDVRGRLPVPLNSPYQEALEIPARSYALETSNAPPHFVGLQELMAEAIEHRVFPGCVILAAKKGKILLERGFGNFDYSAQAPAVDAQTVYDLASLTKVLATLPAVMKLLESGELQLNQTLGDFYRGLSAGRHRDISIAQLLSHSSGLPAWKPLFRSGRSLQEYVTSILGTELETLPGQKMIYSDLGFLLLQDIVEKISGVTLDTFCRDQIYQPMGLTSLHFYRADHPRPSIPPCGADELRPNGIVGLVNDTNCYAIGGVAGHAGLFGTARDVAGIGQLFVQGGIYSRERLFRKSIVELFSQPHEAAISGRCPGWDTPSEGGSAGTLFSAKTIGHLGFTGTSMWVDLEKEIIIVLLSNRVHPDPQHNLLQQFRPRIHNLLMEHLLEITVP